MLPAPIEAHPIAQSWRPDLLDRYRRFAAEVAGAHKLETTIGRGGLSFYVAAGARTFVCHFNAAPRSGREDLGFVDFKPQALVPYLDPPAVVAELQRRLAPAIVLRVGAVWCGGHFDAELDGVVAQTFRSCVVEPLMDSVHA